MQIKIRTIIATLAAAFALAGAAGPIFPADASAARPAPLATGSQLFLSTEGDTTDQELAQHGRCRKIRGRWWCRVFPDTPSTVSSIK